MISPLHFRYLGLLILFITLLYSVRDVSAENFSTSFDKKSPSCGSLLDPADGCEEIQNLRRPTAKILAAIGAVLLIFSGIDGNKLEENLKRRKREEFDGLNDQSDT
jgi:hypothetical protein